MRPKVAPTRRVAAFERVLEALAQELVESTDDELLEAARELGMEPTMRGSAAFIGLRYPAIPRLSDFFELPAAHPLAIPTRRHSLPNRGSATQPRARKKRRKRPRHGDGGA
jgi:hypothetical protein